MKKIILMHASDAETKTDSLQSFKINLHSTISVAADVTTILNVSIRHY